MTHTPEPSAGPMDSIDDAPADADIVARAIVVPITSPGTVAVTAAGTVRKRPKAGEHQLKSATA